MNNKATTQRCGEHNPSYSSLGTPQSEPTSEEEVPHCSPQEEYQPRPQLAEEQGPTYEVGMIPRHQIRKISSPVILQRFLTIDRESEPLRYEAEIGILEGRIREGEDMFYRRIIEEGWEEVNARLEQLVPQTASEEDRCSSEEDGSFQCMLAPQSYPEAYPDSSSE
ncbi:hypothetical protein BGX38DRAFT_1142863 [Terfezia claveryi]|nr:hypothetical protein BGX38DRAFT_1142863 [Terfezia claveryi]